MDRTGRRVEYPLPRAGEIPGDDEVHVAGRVAGVHEGLAPLFEVFAQDAGHCGAPAGAHRGLAPVFEPSVADHFGHPREGPVDRGPAQTPDLLVASGEPVLQAHDRRVPAREKSVVSLAAAEHLRADRLDGPRRERPARQRARGYPGLVAGPAAPRGSPGADRGLFGQAAPVRLDLGHRRRGGRPTQRGGERATHVHESSAVRPPGASAPARHAGAKLSACATVWSRPSTDPCLGSMIETSPAR
jgi:hypothetical protein